MRINKSRILVIILSCILPFTIMGCNNQTLSFNHDKWIRAKETASWDIRKKMAQDLIDKKSLLGESKKDVIQMLGMSEDYSDVKSNELYYTTELKYNGDIDPTKIEYLIVTLNQKQNVTSVDRKIILDK